MDINTATENMYSVLKSILKKGSLIKKKIILHKIYRSLDELLARQ